MPVLFNNVKCTFTVREYMRISSRNTAIPASNMSEKKVFHGFNECIRCVHKPHGHYHPFAKTIPCKESGLQNIFISKMALPVSTAKIDRCEVLCIYHLV